MACRWTAASLPPLCERAISEASSPAASSMSRASMQISASGNSQGVVPFISSPRPVSLVARSPLIGPRKWVRRLSVGPATLLSTGVFNECVITRQLMDPRAEPMPHKSNEPCRLKISTQNIVRRIGRTMAQLYSAGCTYGVVHRRRQTHEIRHWLKHEPDAPTVTAPSCLGQVARCHLAAQPGRLVCQGRAISVHLLSQISSRRDGADDEPALPVLSHRLRQCVAGRGSAH